MNQGLLTQDNRPIAMPSGLAEGAKRVPTPVGAPRLAENDHTLNGEYFSVSLLTGAMTIGVPGRTGFGAAFDRSLSRAYDVVIHRASQSVAGDVPSTAVVALPPPEDPYADATGTGFLIGTGSDPFVRSVSGYSIGTPGGDGFGLAYDLDESELLLQLRHGASNSIVNDIPSTATITLPPPEDPYADATASGFTFDGDPFPVPVDGYTIGVAGAEHFGIAVELDGDTAIIDPLHTASLSVM